MGLTKASSPDKLGKIGPRFFLSVIYQSYYISGRQVRTMLFEALNEMLKESKEKTLEKRLEEREELIQVYSKYQESYPKYAKELGRAEGDFPTPDNRLDMAKILFMGTEIIPIVEDLFIDLIKVPPEEDPETLVAGLEFRKVKTSEVGRYYDICRGVGIPCHMEYRKVGNQESIEQVFDGEIDEPYDSYCRAWHFFTKAIPKSKARKMIGLFADKVLPSILKSELFRDNMIYAFTLRPQKNNMPKGNFSYTPLEGTARFIDPDNFQPYEPWGYLRNVIGEKWFKSRKGMVAPEWVDQAIAILEAEGEGSGKVYFEPPDAEDVNDDTLYQEGSPKVEPDKEHQSVKTMMVAGGQAFDEEDVRLYYRRLNHGDYGITELIVYSTQNKNILATGFFDDENTFVKACRELNGKGNIYAGRNPRPFDFASKNGLKLGIMYDRKKRRASDKDIEYVTALSLDIDPIREKNTSSTDEQHKAALDLAVKISEEIGGSADDSGNGSYVWIPIKPINVTDDNRDEVSAKCKAWMDSIRQMYKPEELGLDIDSVPDLSRVKKVIGTLSVKGAVYRLSRFHTPPAMEPHPSLDQTILSMVIETNKKAVKKPIEVNITDVKDQLPPKFQGLLETDKRLKAFWSNPREDGDASKHDFRLGMLCLERGITDENEIATILSLNPYGRIVKKGKDDGYLTRTIEGLLEKYDDPKTRVDIIRNMNAPEYTIKREISELVYMDMLSKGEFIKADNEHFYFLKSERKLMPIPDSIDFKALLNNTYGLVATERESLYTSSDLQSKCHAYGREAKVYRYAYFDKDSFTLYIDRFDGRMYMLDGDEISLRYNGEDNILFLSDELAEPYEINDQASGGKFHKYIIDRINFNSSETTLTHKEQGLLFRTWLWHVFFESIAPTKPLLLLYGPKGSGKTATAKAVGKLLFGRNFDVSSIGDDQRDFDVLLSNKYLIVLDNLDVKRKWLNDRIAKAATGQAIEVRELYTTNRLARYKPRCFIIITARTPQDRQDDIADRLLILNVERFEQFLPENILMDDVTNYRDDILSGFYRQLNWCIRKLEENQDTSYVGKFRMADFADFGYKIYDGNHNFIKALEKMDEIQNEFLLEEDPIIDILDEWLEDPSNINKGVTAMDLLAEINRISRDKGLEFKLVSPKALSMKLRHQEKNIQQYFDFKIEKRPGNKNLFRFGKKKR